MNKKWTAITLSLLFASGQSFAENVKDFQLAQANADNFKNAVQLANWRPTSGGGAAQGRSFMGSDSAAPSSGGSSWFSFSSTPSVPEKGPVHAKGTIVLNPRTLSWAAYDSDGDLVKSGRASLGRDWCPDTGGSCRTPTGSFYISSYKGADCVSKKYPLVTAGGAPMPYCMFFHGGYAIHGAYDVPDWNASHGCVRITPSAARWLQYNFARVGTAVVIKPY